MSESKDKRIAEYALIKQIKTMKQTLIAKHGISIRHKWEKGFPNGRQVS